MFSFQKPYIPAAQTIGVCGTAANSGATHFSLALCSYLRGRYFAGTAYMEVNSSRAIRVLGGGKEPTTPFTRNGVRIYPEVTIRELPERLCIHSRYKVLDFGVLTPYAQQAFAACDRRIVMTNVSAWKIPQLTQFLERFPYQTNYRKDMKQTIIFVAYGATKTNISQTLKNCGVRVIPFPFLENPFCVSFKYFPVFESICGGKVIT